MVQFIVSLFVFKFNSSTLHAYGHLDVRVKFSPVYRNACSKVFGCRHKDDIKKLSIRSYIALYRCLDTDKDALLTCLDSRCDKISRGPMLSKRNFSETTNTCF
jgi:hypothetical protein